MCVQGVDVQCVLQFTLIHAAGCALHRRTSRVIHRIELSSFEQVSTARATRAEGLRLDSARSCVQGWALKARKPQCVGFWSPRRSEDLRSNALSLVNSSRGLRSKKRGRPSIVNGSRGLRSEGGHGAATLTRKVRRDCRSIDSAEALSRPGPVWR